MDLDVPAARTPPYASLQWWKGSTKKKKEVIATQVKDNPDFNHLNVTKDQFEDMFMFLELV